MNSKSAFLVPFDAPSLLLIGLMCHFIFPGFFVEKVTASVAKRLGAHSTHLCNIRPLRRDGYMLASGGVGNAYEKMPSGISSPSYIREKPSPYL